VKSVVASLLVYNNDRHLRECIRCFEAQTYGNARLIISDNGSTDGSGEILNNYRKRYTVLNHTSNLGFSGGHNRVIREGGFDYFMTLNPDLFMEPDFIAKKVAAFDRDERIGMVAGKVLRIGGQIIDSAGMVLNKSRKNDDRGAGESDRKELDEPGWVFGIMGSEAMFKREMLEDIKVGDEYFDEDFFAYREEADLSWRAQLLGWRCYYEPLAVSRHVHEYATRKRAERSKTARYLQFRNRYLMLMKNDTVSDYLMHLPSIAPYEAALFAWALLREPFLLRAYWEAARMAPKMKRKREIIQTSRKVRPCKIRRLIGEEFIPYS
jgi:GT2 family glycosyltransferase